MSIPFGNSARLSMEETMCWSSNMANKSETHRNFQSHFSPEVIHKMLEDGSYNNHFSDYLRVQVRETCKLAACDGKLTQLFEKKLTLSDVSDKLYRIVIPKKYAVDHFPPMDKGEGMELVFLDQENRSQWAFHYCYSKSSDTFTLTKGWKTFVKEKTLKENDRVIFSALECHGRIMAGARRIYFIGVARHEKDMNQDEGNRSRHAEKREVLLFGVNIAS